MAAKGWTRRFDEPIVLPNGKKLLTLKDAIAWLAKEIPKAEHGMKQMQAAAHCVTQAFSNYSVSLPIAGEVHRIGRQTT
jgi:hypothetical protein